LPLDLTRIGEDSQESDGPISIYEQAFRP
jgi:hypothetical protein